MTTMGFFVKNGRVIDESDVIRKAVAAGVFAGTVTSTAYAGPVSKQVQPIVDVLKDLAEPVAYAFMIYGGLKIASGQSSAGKQTIRDAVSGYILIQWVPWIFSIIKSIGTQ